MHPGAAALVPQGVGAAPAPTAAAAAAMAAAAGTGGAMAAAPAVGQAMHMPGMGVLGNGLAGDPTTNQLLAAKQQLAAIQQGQQVVAAGATQGQQLAAQL